MQVARNRRAQRLCPSQPGVGVLQLRRRGRNDRQRFGQEIEGLTPVQLVGQRREYVQRLPPAAGQFHAHVEQRRRRGQGRSVARDPAQLRRQPQEGPARGSSGGQVRLQCGQVVAGRRKRRGRWVVTAKRLETIEVRQCQPRRARRARSAHPQPGQGGQEDEECQPEDRFLRSHRLVCLSICLLVGGLPPMRRCLRRDSFVRRLLIGVPDQAHQRACRLLGVTGQRDGEGLGPVQRPLRRQRGQGGRRLCRVKGA